MLLLSLQRNGLKRLMPSDWSLNPDVMAALRHISIYQMSILDNNTNVRKLLK